MRGSNPWFTLCSFVWECVWERESVCVCLRVWGLPSRSTAGERRVKRRSLELLCGSITPPDQHPHAGSARATHQFVSLWNSNKRKKAGVAEMNWNSYGRGIKQMYEVTAKQHRLSSPNSFSCKHHCLTPLIHPFFPPSLSLLLKKRTRAGRKEPFDGVGKRSMLTGCRVKLPA